MPMAADEDAFCKLQIFSLLNHVLHCGATDGDGGTGGAPVEVAAEIEIVIETAQAVVMLLTHVHADLYS